MKIKNVSYKIEEYVKPANITQCHNCEGFGHKASNCHNHTRCVKCGENHNSRECKVSELKCANCKGNHSASYKGCPVYKEEINKAKNLENKNTGAQTLSYSNIKHGSHNDNALQEILKICKTNQEELRNVSDRLNTIDSSFKSLNTQLNSVKKDCNTNKENIICYFLDIISDTCPSGFKEQQQWNSALEKLETHKIYENLDVKDRQQLKNKINEISTSKFKPKESN